MSKDYEFETDYTVEDFRALMTSKGVILGDVSRPKEGDRRSYGSFNMTFDNKNYLVVWITNDCQRIEHVTRYGINDSTPFIKLFQELDEDIDLDRDL